MFPFILSVFPALLRNEYSIVNDPFFAQLGNDTSNVYNRIIITFGRCLVAYKIDSLHASGVCKGRNLSSDRVTHRSLRR